MRQQGFTLIELIITCAIISIISFVSVNSYRYLIIQTKAQSDKLRLLSLVQMTRLHSITTSSVTVLCPSINKQDCIRRWDLPLIQFVDSNKNRKRDENEAIIGQFELFTHNDVRINYPRNQIRFDEKGGANGFNGTLSYCFENEIEGIVISRVGRFRFAQDLNGDHIPDVNLNSSVTC